MTTEPTTASDLDAVMGFAASYAGAIAKAGIDRAFGRTSDAKAQNAALRDAIRAYGEQQRRDALRTVYQFAAQTKHTPLDILTEIERLLAEAKNEGTVTT